MDVIEGRKHSRVIKEEFRANRNPIGPVLTGFVDGGFVAEKIAGFEDVVDKWKVYYEPTDLGCGCSRC